MQERNDSGYPQQPHPAPRPAQYYAPPAKQKPTVRRRTAIAAGAVGLVLGAGIGAAGHSNKTDTTTNAGTASTPTATATVTRTQNAPAGAAHTVTAPAPAAVTHTVKAAPPAPSTTAPPKSTVVFSTSGDGIKKTASFTTAADWSVTYTYNCVSAGMGTGNFILSVDSDFGDTLANALSEKGGDTSYEHDNPGSHFLSVNSECDWTLKVTNG